MLKWKIIKSKKRNPILPEGRRNHGAILIGNWMLIYAGINKKDVYLNDFWALSILNHKW